MIKKLPKNFRTVSMNFKKYDPSDTFSIAATRAVSRHVLVLIELYGRPKK